MRQYLDDIIGMVIILFFILDWLWIFGVEASRSYTWWALIAHFAQ